MGQFHKAVSGIDHLELLGRGNSPVHALGAAPKLAVTLAYIVFVVSFPRYDISGLVPFVFYPVIMMSLSGTPFRPLLRRLLVALPFAAVIGISNIILDREGAFRLGSIVVTGGVISCCSIILKTIFSVFAVLILIATPPFVNIAALLTAAKPLRVIGLQIVLTYRSISTLLGEAGDMWTAYMLRAPGVKAIRMRDMGTFLGQLLLRSFDKAERVYNAMKCRGFSGAFVTMANPERACHSRTADIIFVAAALAVFCLLRFVNVSVLLGKMAV
jgi:cobalt/nickel transport system permease protein